MSILREVGDMREGQFFLGGWVGVFGDVGCALSLGNLTQRKKSPDFRSLEVGISVKESMRSQEIKGTK